MTSPSTTATSTAASSACRPDGATPPTRSRGRSSTAHDVSMAGMLWGALRRSDLPHARLTRVDTSRAEALPGVRAVITADDIGDHRASRYVRDEPMLARGPGPLPGRTDRGRRRRLAGDRPGRGPPHRRRVRPASGGREPARRLRARRPAAPPGLGGLLAGPDPAEKRQRPQPRPPRAGRRRCGLRRSGPRVRGTPTTSPTRCIRSRSRAVWRSPHVDGDGDVHVVSSHQFPFGLRQDLSDILGIPLGKIRVTVSGLGGGFGGKLYAGVEPVLHPALTAPPGAPSRSQHTREEEMTRDVAADGGPHSRANRRLRVGPSARARGDAPLRRRGHTRSRPPGVISARADDPPPGPYRWEALRIDSLRHVHQQGELWGRLTYRGPGAPQAVFAGETQLDRIADRTRDRPARDPPAATPSRTATSVPRTAAGRREPPRRPFVLQPTGSTTARERPAGTGVGPSPCSWWTTTGRGLLGLHPGSTRTASVVLTTGATEIGTGAVQAGVAQICAEELGVGLDDLKIVSADTDAHAVRLRRTEGSLTTTKWATRSSRAVADLKEQLFALAAPKLGVRPVRPRARRSHLPCGAVMTWSPPCRSQTSPSSVRPEAASWDVAPTSPRRRNPTRPSPRGP